MVARCISRGCRWHLRETSIKGKKETRLRDLYLRAFDHADKMMFTHDIQIIWEP